MADSDSITPTHHDGDAAEQVVADEQTTETGSVEEMPMADGEVIGESIETADAEAGDAPTDDDPVAEVEAPVGAAAEAEPAAAGTGATAADEAVGDRGAEGADERAASEADAPANEGAPAEDAVADAEAAGGTASADAASTEDAPAPADEAAPADARDPRIPAVITARTLFFLAPDLPPLPERRGPARHDQVDQVDEGDDEGDDQRSRGRGRSRRGRRGGVAREQQDERRPQQQRQERDDEPADEPEPITEPQKLHGSTRLAAKRQRRREGHDTGRRRTVVTESEFQARREAVDRKMLVRAKNNRVQIGVLEDNVLVEHYVARSSENSLIGNVYLGKVQNVLPSMEAAFIDIGKGRNAVLYSGEVNWSEFEGSNSARKIENALKPGDQVLVQVTKDPIGHKGARLTSQISLPGRFLVYVPGNSMTGISRKLPDNERARLKKILKEVLPPGVGVIVRTAAEGASEEELRADVERLTKQWDDIQQKAKGGKAPQTLHAEPDMLIKIIRDVFNEDFQKIVIQGQSELDTIKHYLGQVAPDLLERVERYSGSGDLFADYRADEAIAKAMDRKVWLPSGGSLVIDRTEAMTVVDVNTGKFTGSGGNLEETVTRNNLEAAEEVIRQIRLRDIGGIIVVDFIDMVLESNRDLVVRRLVECLGRDRTKHQVAEVTSLGLVQMTRKKLGLGLLESFSEQCESCDGRGVHIHSEPVSQGSGGGRSGRSRRGRGGQDGGAEGGQHGGGRQGGQQSGGRQQQAKPANGNGNGNGTHEITEDARNALTKIAASTIAGAVKSDAEAPVIEGAAERLAIAAAAAAAGKSAEQVVAAAEAVEPGGEQDASGGESSGRDGEDGGSRRSRRGRRGRGRGRGDNGQHDSSETGSQEPGWPSDDRRDGERRDERRSEPGGEPTSGAGAEERSADERPEIRIELPEPRRDRERGSSAPAASLGDLDAALDSLAGGRASEEPGERERPAQREPEQPAEREARTEPEQRPEQRPEQQAEQPVAQAAPADAPQAPAASERPTSGRRTRGQRRRVTTGPITADDAE